MSDPTKNLIPPSPHKQFLRLQSELTTHKPAFAVRAYIGDSGMVAKRIGPFGAKGIDENIDKFTGFFDK